jgi:hypothetical protein
MATILLIILILVLIGAFPTWPHSRKWGYGPSGLTGLIAVVLIIMLPPGRLKAHFCFSQSVARFAPRQCPGGGWIFTRQHDPMSAPAPAH